eukprot:scaffold7296_cov100-Isochrysis_galbana.AAC.5
MRNSSSQVGPNDELAVEEVMRRRPAAALTSTYASGAPPNRRIWGGRDRESAGLGQSGSAAHGGGNAVRRHRCWRHARLALARLPHCGQQRTSPRFSPLAPLR